MPKTIEHRGTSPQPAPATPQSSPLPTGKPDVLPPKPPTEAQLRARLTDPNARADAAAALWNSKGADPAPVDERAVAALARSLGPRFARFENASVVMLSDASTARVNARLGTIDRARTEFLKWADRAGLHPAPEPTKHLCVLFASRADYVAFAREQDGLDASEIGGHYSPTKERMALYAESTGGPDDLVARCIHETIHMVAFRTTAQSRRRTQPLWLSEGMASAFEPASSSAAPVAPDRPKPGARERYLASDQTTGAILPIATLVALTAPPREVPGSAAASYRSSAALFRYLARYHSRDLGRYMETLATDDPGIRTPHQLLAEFIAHFGDPIAIQKDMALRPW